MDIEKLMLGASIGEGEFGGESVSCWKEDIENCCFLVLQYETVHFKRT